MPIYHRDREKICILFCVTEFLQAPKCINKVKIKLYCDYQSMQVSHKKKQKTIETFFFFFNFITK